MSEKGDSKKVVMVKSLKRNKQEQVNAALGWH
jgi:hypothetical protein